MADQKSNVADQLLKGTFANLLGEKKTASIAQKISAANDNGGIITIGMPSTTSKFAGYKVDPNDAIKALQEVADRTVTALNIILNDNKKVNQFVGRQLEQQQDNINVVTRKIKDINDAFEVTKSDVNLLKRKLAMMKVNDIKGVGVEASNKKKEVAENVTPSIDLSAMFMKVVPTLLKTALPGLVLFAVKELLDMKNEKGAKELEDLRNKSDPDTKKKIDEALAAEKKKYGDKTSDHINYYADNMKKRMGDTYNYISGGTKESNNERRRLKYGPKTSSDNEVTSQGQYTPGFFNRMLEQTRRVTSLGGILDGTAGTQGGLLGSGGTSIQGGRAAVPRFRPGIGGDNTRRSGAADNGTLGDNAGGNLGNLIASGESGARGYNAYNRGQANQPTEKLDFSQMTLKQVMEQQSQRQLFAVGKYQVIPSTMREVVDRLKLDPDQKFTPELQERIFRDGLVGGKRPEMKDYITGGGDRSKAMEGAAKEWAAVGSERLGGKSVYSGQAGNAASISPAAIGKALDIQRQAYADNIAKGMKPDEAYAASFNASIKATGGVATAEPTTSYSIDKSKTIAAIRANEPLARLASDDRIWSGLQDNIKEKGITIKDGKLVGDSKAIDEVIGGFKSKYPSADVDSLISKQKSAPDATPVKPGTIAAVTDEEKRAYKNSGTIDLKDPETGKLLGHYPFVTGGGGRGSAPTGTYDVGEEMKPGDALGNRFVLTKKGDKHDTATDPGIPGVLPPAQRSALRIHRSNGEGTLGCIGIVGDDKLYADFEKNLLYVKSKTGGKLELNLGSAQAQKLMNDADPVKPGSEPPIKPTDGDPVKPSEASQPGDATAVKLSDKEQAALKSVSDPDAVPDLHERGDVPSGVSDLGVKPKTATGVTYDAMGNVTQSAVPEDQPVAKGPDASALQPYVPPLDGAGKVSDPMGSNDGAAIVESGKATDAAVAARPDQAKQPDSLGRMRLRAGPMTRPTHHPDQMAPGPGHDGYGQKNDPDQIGICTI